MKAYMSTDAPRSARSAASWHHRSTREALDELTRILSETETPCVHSALSYWSSMAATDKRDHPLCLTRLRDDLTADLAALVADGGPLDTEASIAAIRAQSYHDPAALEMAMYDRNRAALAAIGG